MEKENATPASAPRLERWRDFLEKTAFASVMLGVVGVATALLGMDSLSSTSPVFDALNFGFNNLAQGVYTVAAGLGAVGSASLVGAAVTTAIDHFKNPTFVYDDPEGSVEVTPSRGEVLQRLSNSRGISVDFNNQTIHDVTFAHSTQSTPVPLQIGNTSVLQQRLVTTENMDYSNGQHFNEISDPQRKAKLAQLTAYLEKAKAGHGKKERREP